jgi:hypothetical protein
MIPLGFPGSSHMTANASVSDIALGAGTSVLMSLHLI